MKPTNKQKFCLSTLFRNVFRFCCKGPSKAEDERSACRLRIECFFILSLGGVWYTPTPQNKRETKYKENNTNQNINDYSTGRT